MTKFGYLVEERSNLVEERSNLVEEQPKRQKLLLGKTKSTNATNPTLTKTAGSHLNKETYRQILKEAILEFQTFFNLPKTGILDSATASQMQVPRCNKKDKANDILKLNVILSKHGRLKKRSFSVFQKLGFTNTEMTWTLDNNQPDGKYLHMVNVLDLIEFGLNIWAKVTNIKFKRMPYRDFYQADIYFSFHAGKLINEETIFIKPLYLI